MYYFICMRMSLEYSRQNFLEFFFILWIPSFCALDSGVKRCQTEVNITVSCSQTVEAWWVLGVCPSSGGARRVWGMSQQPSLSNGSTWMKPSPWQPKGETETRLLCQPVPVLISVCFLQFWSFVCKCVAMNVSVLKQLRYLSCRRLLCRHILQGIVCHILIWRGAQDWLAV